MKKYLLTLILIFSCLVPAVYAASGTLKIESEYTFESIPDGTVVLHDFIIKNNKDIPVKITGVKPG